MTGQLKNVSSIVTLYFPYALNGPEQTEFDETYHVN
jgi:hypothetical protein